MPPYLSQDDHLNSFRLDVTVDGSRTLQTRIFSDREGQRRRVKETTTWHRKRELGRGGFGIVHLQEDDQGRLRAVKEIPSVVGKQRSIDPMREISAMAAFSKNETNFVKLEGWFEIGSHLYICMEYFEYGDLQQCLDQALCEAEAQDVTAQIAEAIDFMHQKNFVHRDLKPANVFVVAKSPNWWVKLADLGITKRIQEECTSLYTTFFGDFMAPEVLGLVVDSDTDRYTNAVDMWALGVFAYWLLTLQIPLSHRTLFLFCTDKIDMSFEDLKARAVSKNGIDFIEKLVKPIPQSRMTSVDALNHKWLIVAGTETVCPPSATLSRHENDASDLGEHRKPIREAKDANSRKHYQSVASQRPIAPNHNDTRIIHKQGEVVTTEETSFRQGSEPQHIDLKDESTNLPSQTHVMVKRDTDLQAAELDLALKKKTLGKEHPDTLRSMHNLALEYGEAGRREEAIQLYQRLIPIRQRVLGEEHPNTLSSMYNLALEYSRAGRQEESIQLYQRLVPIRQRVLGEEHPNTLDSMHNLAYIYGKAGRREESTQLYQLIIPLFQKVFGENDHKTLFCINYYTRLADEKSIR